MDMKQTLLVIVASAIGHDAAIDARALLQTEPTGC